MNLSKLKENKLFMLLMAGVVVLVAILLVVSVFSLFRKERASSYNGLESKLISAAKSYYKKEVDRLPATIGATIEIDATSLAEAGYLDGMREISPKGSTCSGRVVVKNVNGNYLYQAYIDCGEKYKTLSLSDYLKTAVPLETTNAGLYKVGNEYYYRGEIPNNYLSFAEQVYRILRVNEDGTIDIIANEKRERDVWDDRYNEEREGNDGINNFALSRIRDSLNRYIHSEEFLDEERLMLEPMSLCVGKVFREGTMSLNQECSSRLDGQLVGLLPVSLYTHASLDPACTSILSGSCQNYNYLNVYNGSFWTLTGEFGSSSYVAQILSGGTVNFIRASSSSGLREVLRITNQAVYVSGDGTIENPYVIK
jgi:hypothetical protein